MLALEVLMSALFDPRRLRAVYHLSVNIDGASAACPFDTAWQWSRADIEHDANGSTFGTAPPKLQTGPADWCWFALRTGLRG